MADRAHVTSVDAIELFRANLLAYLGKARPVLEDACDEVFRTRQWLQHDRRTHWENQLKRRRKILEEAEQALFGARISNLREPTSAETAAVTRAKRALNDAEEKLRLVKRWTMEFDNRVQPLVKELEGLRTMLANDMPKAAAHLAQVIKTLDAYAGVKPGGVVSAMPTGEAKSAEVSEAGLPETETP
jgi:hypothetical protein